MLSNAAPARVETLADNVTGLALGAVAGVAAACTGKSKSLACGPRTRNDTTSVAMRTRSSSSHVPVSRKTYSPATLGTHLAVALSAPPRATVGPAIWLQPYLMFGRDVGFDEARQSDGLVEHGIRARQGLNLKPWQGHGAHHQVKRGGACRAVTAGGGGSNRPGGIHRRDRNRHPAVATRLRNGDGCAGNWLFGGACVRTVGILDGRRLGAQGAV